MVKNKLIHKMFFMIALFFMAAFPIYRNVQYGGALSQYSRQKDFLRGEMEFYNPWQYRVLSPLINYTLYQIYTNTFDKVIKVARFFPDKNPEMIRYFVVFTVFRFLLHLILFYLCIVFWSNFIENKWLIYLGLSLLVLFIGNAVYDSDFSFNNYIDAILYISTGILIFKPEKHFYLIIICIIGALNRETSLLIPFVFWMAHAFTSKFHFPDMKINLIVFLSIFIFASIFIGIRAYYGYRPPEFYQARMGWNMLKLNLFSSKSILSYFEVFGTVSILPLWCIYHFQKSSRLLQILFISLVPAWFITHYILVVAWESRLFIVPTVLVFIPMVLEQIEKSYMNS